MSEVLKMRSLVNDNTENVDVCSRAIWMHCSKQPEQTDLVCLINNQVAVLK